MQQYRLVVDLLLVLERDGRVLLARRANTGYADGLWNMPSGKLENGESAVEGMIREAKEELGVRILADALEHVTTLHYRVPEGNGRIGLVFTTIGYEGEPYNAEPHKCSELAWWPADALPEDTVPYTAAAVAQYKNGSTFASPGW